MRDIKLSLNMSDLSKYLKNQVDFLYPDKTPVKLSFLKECVGLALERIKVCFDPIIEKYYFKENNSIFNHLHGDHYATFLYFVSNNAFKLENISLATKVHLLNKAMFGIDLFYDVELPDHFMLSHPIGTVLGRAKYSDFFLVHQQVTVGGTNDLLYPSFEGSAILFSNSSVIGNCKIGGGFILAANSSIINLNIEKNKTVIGVYPTIRKITSKKETIKDYWDI